MMFKSTKSLVVVFALLFSSILSFGQGDITFGFYIDANCNGVRDVASEPLMSGPDAPVLFNTLTGMVEPIAPVGNTYPMVPAGDYELQWQTPSNGWIIKTPANAITVITGHAGTSQTFLAAYYQEGQIEGFTWTDLDGDGIQDGAEVGLDGVDVTLTGTSCSGAAIGPITVTSAGGGIYTFPNLEPSGTAGYTLTFDLPAGHERSDANEGGNDNIDSDPNVTTGIVTGVVVTSGSTVNNVDAGYFENSIISDFVWEDINGNGIQDGEPGIAGVNVTLTGTDGAGNAVALAVVTDGAGLYEFDNVPPGNDYIVDFTLPSANHFFTPQDEGGDDTADSDANPANGQVTNIDVMSGDAPRTDIDAGMYIGATISDFVWEDLNGDGDQDGGEPGFAGITATLTGTDGTGTAITPQVVVTPGSGLYLFDELAPGDYVVTFTGLPANHFWTDPDQAGGDDDLDSDANPMTGATPSVNLSSDEDIDNIDAGLFEAVTIGNLVWEDINGNGIQDGGEPGLNGVTVSLDRSDGMPFTKANGAPAAPVVSGPAGAYVFDILKPGSYVVTFEDFPTYFRTLKDVGAEASDSDADITTGETDDIIVISGDVNNNIDGGYFEGCTIKDVTWEDMNGNGLQDGGEPGLDGVMMTLTDAMGMPVNNALGVAVGPEVSAGGMYEFIDLRPGTYVVTFAAPAGYFPTRVNAAGGATDATDAANDSDCNQANMNRTHDIILTSGEEEEDIDAGFYEPVVIGDFVWHDADADGIQDAGEPPLENITITLANADMSPLTNVNNVAIPPVMTDAAGMYMFTDLRPGSYRLTVTAAGWLFSVADNGGDATDSDFNAMGVTTSDVVLESGDPDNIDVDAGLYMNITLCGTVWSELDDNGMQAAGENGVENVTINLTGTAGDGMAIALTTLTDANGEYCFEVKPGDYVVTIPASDFDAGGPLLNFVSCTPTADPNDDVDMDDNGDGDGPAMTGLIELRCGEEPTGMGVENETVDFCFKIEFDCSDPTGGGIFVESCETVIDTFCDLVILNSGCGVMFPGPLLQPAPNPLCDGGGAPHNMSWFAFIAGEGDYTIDIIPSNCVPGAGGQLGVQTGIYTDCSFSESIFCMNACSTNPISVPSDNLIPGNTYYWWFDGCSGSICQYEINVNGDYSVYIIPEPEEIVCISNVCSPICPNNTITLQVNSDYETATLKFLWQITDPNGVITTVQTLTNQLPDILLNIVGTWKFEIISISNKCNTTSTVRSIEILVRNPPNEDFGTISLCENYIPSGVATAISDLDPNMDGFFGWGDANYSFMAGPAPGVLNSFNFVGPANSDQPGCMYNQQVRVIRKLNSPPVDRDFILCKDEIPFVVSPDFPFPISGNLEDITVVLPDAAANGCDSTVIVNSIILEAFNGEVINQGCQNGKTLFLLQSEILPSAPNIGNVTTTYRWRRVDNGQLINDGNPDGNLKTILLSIPGEYVCEIVMTLNGKTCVTEVPFEFIPLDVLPIPTPFNWNTNFCSSLLQTTYEAQSSESNPVWNWTVPAGVSVTGNTTNSITITWNNVLGGEICVSIKDNCGTSIPFCDTVVITKVPTSRFNLEDIICVDSLGRAEFTATPKFPGANYNWTLDGGSIISSPTTNGIDTIDIKWPTAGKKYVSLVVVNNGPMGLQCPSLPYRDSIVVVPKQAPPIVDCETTATSLTFTWTPLAGQVGQPVVNVLVGPTGVLSGNMYTISGQLPGVNAQLEFVFNNNHACGVVKSLAECTTQNCTPEDLTFNAPTGNICLTATSPTIDLQPLAVPSITTNGTFTFTGPGVTVGSSIFDPKVAGIGDHIIRCKYRDVLGCETPTRTITISVKQTPTSAFVIDSPICQDSTTTVAYNGNIASGGSFAWDFGPNTTTVGANAGPFQLGWSTTGMKTVTLTVTNDGCTSTPSTRNVEVEPRIEPVTITCVEGPTSLSFDWNDLANVSGYIVTLNNNIITTPPSTQLNLTGLPTDQFNTIVVEAISNTECPGTVATLTCRTDGCPKISVKFSRKDSTICNLPTNVAFPINVTLTGGLQSIDQKITWSGPGVTQNPTNDKQGIFDPNVAGPGVHTIMMSLVDGTCKKDTTMKITVIDRPVSTFTGVNKHCVIDQYQLTFTGTTGLPVNFSSSTGVVITQVAGQPTRYNVSFPIGPNGKQTPGTYTINCVVGNPGCLSETTSLTVVVDPELESVKLECTVTTSSISFTWQDIECAAVYNVKLDGVNRGNQSTFNFNINNLMVGDSRTLIITPISTCACPPLADTLTCVAKDCPIITVSASTPNDAFCLGSVTTPIQLASSVTGSDGSGSGSWSGPNCSPAGLVNVVGLTPGKYDYEYKFTQEGCNYTASTSITIYDLPQLSIAVDQPDCYQNNVGQATPTVVGAGTYTYTLGGAAVILPIAPQPAGSYTVVVTDVNKCTDDETFTVVAATEPTIALTASATDILSEQPVEITSTITGLVGTIDSIVWYDKAGVRICSGVSCTKININPKETDTYCAKVYFNTGCDIEACIEIRVKKVVVITIPNVVTVGSNSNGVLFVQNYEAVKQVKEMQIYDRWGNLLFSKKDVPAGDPSQGWDGTLNGKSVVPGVYVYKIKLELIDGKLEDFNGDVTVLEGK